MPRIRPTGAALVVGTMIGAVALAGCGAGQITQTSSQQSAVNGAYGNAGSIAVRDLVIAFPERAPQTAAVYPRGGDAPLEMSIANSSAQPDRLVSASSPAAASVRISGATEIAGNQRIVIEGAPPEATPTTAPGGSAAPGSTASAALAPTATGVPGAGPSGAPATTASVAPSATPAAAPGTAAVPSGSAQPPVQVPTGPPSPAADNPTVTATSGPGGFNPAGPGQGTVVNPEAVNQGTQVVLTGLTDDIRSGLTYPVVLTFEKAGDVRISVPVAVSSETREAEPAE